ncbi:sodium/nucleoside cotransporter 1 [Pyricularia oryzae 70-15]|uniref:Sodium/nucleoside cotransporter 1 n=3 Tax=Pyricularia oryzae TaxID=318829 RepID=G4MLU3_PYRO7|nr:sodium/nucleoside cotransporter 1 [Pyricularia oryzae 70-15]EHA57721.1 sodium/nucleoside cotransporter 1 [Pyricularia oryzae 70-15]ELQ35306.1 sodium/nucleoside cotransporter 1 [Pyricularia oryzae Y34]KAI7911999.1 sodium/nucleoside cotransporter 1 [Pyricularia oryzae]KAI7915766.1 sodium/nucleoside cotransporter 1 [Pyricularia oryzae]
MSAPATDDKMAPRRPSAERTATAATETHSVYATPGATTTLGANTTPGAVVANTADHITPAQANQQHTNAPVYNDEKASLSSRRDSDPKAAPQYMDAEKGSSDTVPADQHQPEESPSKVKLFYRRHRTVIRLVIEALVFVFFTVWFVYGIVAHNGIRRSDNYGWLKPMLFYIAVVLRIFFNHAPTSVVMTPLSIVWNNTVVRLYDVIPKKLHQPLAGLGTLGVFLVGTMVSPDEAENTRANRAISIFGLLVMIAFLTVTSRNWRAIPWHTVIGGMLTQFIIAIFVLRSQAGFDIFEFISFLARSLLGFANAGVTFLTDATVPEKPWFFTGVIPAIIFFVALVQLLFYAGLIQWFIGKFAKFFFWSLRVSGAEAVVASATPFIGQGESAMLVKPFVPYMTKAELHQVMTCGFATIAGSVLVAYIGLGLNRQALVSSCIMSIPASLAVSKMRYPETEESLTAGNAVVPKEESPASNALEAFANGAWLGLKIAGMIIATLLCIIAFVAMIDGILGWIGVYFDIGYFGGEKLSINLILGYIFFPVAWLLGVPGQDCLRVARLIGIKIIQNEFVAFLALADQTGEYASMSERSKLIATYAICGFGNVGSLGTQIGVLSQLAPSRTADVSSVAISALLAGILSTLTSASVAGMLYTESMGKALEAAAAS